MADRGTPYGPPGWKAIVSRRIDGLRFNYPKIRGASLSGGVLRFLLFVTAVALAGTGYFAYGQMEELEAYRKANAALNQERDGLVAKNGELMAASKTVDAKVQELTSRVADLQAQLEAIKAPRGRR